MNTAVVDTTPTPVTVVDIEMPFASMVLFMVKWAIATIPAVILLFALLGIPFLMLTELL